MIATWNYGRRFGAIRHSSQMAEVMPHRSIEAAATAIGRAPVKIRTSNLLIRSQMLYPVELRALKAA
jgi:hypothetical protein